MVGSIDPKTGTAAVVSIPRDMAGIPLANGGNSGSMRVNAIYFLRYRDPSLGHMPPSIARPSRSSSNDIEASSWVPRSTTGP